MENAYTTRDKEEETEEEVKDKIKIAEEAKAKAIEAKKNAEEAKNKAKKTKGPEKEEAVKVAKVAKAKAEEAMKEEKEAELALKKAKKLEKITKKEGNKLAKLLESATKGINKAEKVEKIKKSILLAKEKIIESENLIKEIYTKYINNAKYNEIVQLNDKLEESINFELNMRLEKYVNTFRVSDRYNLIHDEIYGADFEKLLTLVKEVGGTMSNDELDKNLKEYDASNLEKNEIDKIFETEYLKQQKIIHQLKKHLTASDKQRWRNINDPEHPINK